MILVIDNYDSFVHNLARYIRVLGFETKVVRNDQVNKQVIDSLSPDAIVISPGPCGPDEAGYSIAAVQEFGTTIPILGICLGHQAIIQAFGGPIVRSFQPVHGRRSRVTHGGGEMFQRIPSPFWVGRYHSLIADSNLVPDRLRVTARTEDGIVMAVEHHERPIVGLQFHPESILTEGGYQLLFNFLTKANLNPRVDVADTPVERLFETEKILSGRLSQRAAE